MSLRSRIQQLEEVFEFFGRDGTYTDAKIRASAREEGVPEEIMFEIWDKLVGQRRLDPYGCGILIDAIECYKRDPEEYRRRVTENDWKDAAVVVASAGEAGSSS